MNTTLNQMINRYSVRKYQTDAIIPEEHLDLILRATQMSPTYINAQQYSVIVITDQDKKNKMLEHTMPSSGNPQQHIADCSAFLLFVADFHKMDLIAKKENTTFQIGDSIEGLMIATMDVGIGVEAATVAAESLGYGTVVIGAVRRSTEALIKEYNLPAHTYPMLGLCIGVPAAESKQTPKPRLALHSFAHDNTYSLKDFDQTLDQYNKSCNDFQSQNNMSQYRWTEFVANFYNKSYWNEQSSVYLKQGLGSDFIKQN